jgi:hypothetical protein
VLALLRAAGYQTVSSAGTDTTLIDTGAGLAVHGRGAHHQIDGIADYLVGVPFSHPHRLLVEAKNYSTRRRIGLDIVRNAVGTLRDVTEYWTRRDASAPLAGRYHYQYAILGATDFTQDAEHYSFAQDIYLLPLRRSAVLSGILDAIDTAARSIQHLPFSDQGVSVSTLRRSLRARLQGGVLEIEPTVEWPDALQPVADAVASVGLSYVATVGRSLPVLLTPVSPQIMELVTEQMDVRIQLRGEQWFIAGADDQPLFSFDLPQDLLRLYWEEGRLTPRGALEVKQRYLSDWQFIRVDQGRARLVQLGLDQGWLEQIVSRVRE